MTKKIKFFDDAKTLSILVVTANKVYLITEETETHYTFYDDDNIKTSIYKLKSGYKFEIIEEPEALKTSALEDIIRINSEYQYIGQQQIAMK